MPVYSHESYDVVPDVTRELVDAAVVIVEGVNALQFRDQLDLGVYVDAPEAAIERWYADRLVGDVRRRAAGVVLRRARLRRGAAARVRRPGLVGHQPP